MKKLLIVAVALLFVVSTAFAADFAPTLLKLSADPIIQYSFDGSELKIPVEVSGTSAGIVFCVFTRGKADDIQETQNGFMGWHYVNKVDTCIYYSSMRSFVTGQQTITWDGKDQDGAVVPPGEYTYYLWAFDNQGAKTLAAIGMPPTRGNYIQETDEAGLPLDRPVILDIYKRWKIGNDPLDETLFERSSLTAAEGWNLRSTPVIQQDDHSILYVNVLNYDSHSGGVHKFKWVPDGDSELQTDWGNDGYSDLVSMPKNWISDVTTNGDYLYTAQGDWYESIPAVDFYIFDMDGGLVDQVDLTSWWSSPDEFEAGGQMNGGINTLCLRNGYGYLNSHTSCHVQMVDPVRFLESGEKDDFIVWSNDNGDYVLDHNFEETSMLMWVCNDSHVGPYKYTISADDNLFSIVMAYDIGASNFAICAPDGTGLGYYAAAGETGGLKSGNFLLDGDTPFDGMYLDNRHTGGHHTEYDKDKAENNLYFLGQDSISGLIMSGVGVVEEAPTAFSVAQNAPNPFNPTTTISFSLAEACNVSIEVYNVAGQKVDTLVDGFMNAGSHSMVWDASDFSAGVYFYTVKSGGFSKTMKMTLLK